MQSWTWIATAADLSRFVQTARSSGSLAIDTEFVRRRTYHAELGLVQLAAGEEIFLLDPLATEAESALGELLADPQLRKLIHAGGEDIEVLQRWSGATPSHLVDTQIANQFAGVPGQIGYQRMVAERLDIALSKGEQQSDWMRRPLSEKQCRYAADDVRYLHPVAAQILAEVDRLGRNEWLAEECQRQIDRVLAAPSEFPHLAERNAGSYPRLAQWRLCQLLRWRVAEAQQRDKPKNWILDSGLAVAIAHCQPGELQAMSKAMADAGRRDPERAASKLDAILTEAGDGPNDAFPIAPEPIDGEQKKSVKSLRAALIAAAESLGLAPEFIATRAVLEQAVRDGRWPESIGQWRAQVVAELDPSAH